LRGDLTRGKTARRSGEREMQSQITNGTRIKETRCRRECFRGKPTPYIERLKRGEGLKGTKSREKRPGWFPQDVDPDLDKGRKKKRLETRGRNVDPSKAINVANQRGGTKSED